MGPVRARRCGIPCPHTCYTSRMDASNGWEKAGVMRLVQVAQHASDLQRAAEFYSALLSARYTAVFDPPGLLFFDLDGVRLLLEQGAPSSLLYLGVPDVKRTVEQLKGRGVEIVAEPRVIFSHDDGLLGARRHGGVDGIHPGQRGKHPGAGQPDSPGIAIPAVRHPNACRPGPRTPAQ